MPDGFIPVVLVNGREYRGGLIGPSEVCATEAAAQKLAEKHAKAVEGTTIPGSGVKVEATTRRVCERVVS